MGEGAAVIYYGNPCSDDVRSAMSDGLLGCITTPLQGNVVAPEWDVIADNGCFSDRWDPGKWREWLPSVTRSARFAVVPDVVGDHRATLDRWVEYAPYVTSIGFAPAFVCQDGCTLEQVPMDASALFLGGSTSWKLGTEAERIARAWSLEGGWVHMGRVNSLRRMMTAAEWGCSSVDGTYLTFGPEVNLPRLLGWLRALETRTPQLPMEVTP